MGIYDSYFQEFPESIRYSEDPEWGELAVIMDGIDAELRDSIYRMKHLWDEDKCPEEFLPFVSFAIHGRVENGETSILKRKKVWSAVARHRVKGQESIMLDLIEEITGVRPAIIPPFEAYDIWESKNNLMPFPYDFMKWGTKQTAESGGMIWNSISSQGASGAQNGEIFINLRLANLSPMVIRKIVRVIEYAGAAFFRYYLGNLSLEGWYEYRKIY